MPFFLAPLVPSLIAWGGRALATYGLARLFSENSVQELEEMLTGWVVGQVAARAGLQLDPQSPFSDASLAGAVSQKTGVPLRSLKDRAMIEEDLDDYAAALVSSRIGFQLSTLRDPVRLRADFERAALAVITEKTGIPLVPAAEGETLSVDTIKAQVEDWAKARVMTELSTKAGAALEELGAAGVDFESLAQTMNEKLAALGSANVVDARMVALEVAERLVSSSVAQLHQTAVVGTKKSRRALQVLKAQQRFRALHGNRQKYVPLGMSANIG